MLENVHNADNINGPADKAGTDIFFNSELMQQQNEMKKLDEAIEEQQKKLLQDCDLKNHQDVDAFCIQDILRQRIKAIEKTYIDLKCNFMNYLSTIS
jgi:predicted mannosyl-3-phosphoglycerate phosphatase (HAD superfamily)